MKDADYWAHAEHQLEKRSFQVHFEGCPEQLPRLDMLLSPFSTIALHLFNPIRPEGLRTTMVTGIDRELVNDCVGSCNSAVTQPCRWSRGVTSGSELYLSCCLLHTWWSFRDGAYWEDPPPNSTAVAKAILQSPSPSRTCAARRVLNREHGTGYARSAPFPGQGSAEWSRRGVP